MSRSPHAACRQARAPASNSANGSVTPPAPAAVDRGRGRGVLLVAIALPQRGEQLRLATEVVVQAAHAGLGLLDHLGDRRLGEPAPGEHHAGGVEELRTGLLGAAPLPRSPAGVPCRHRASSSPDRPGVARCGTAPRTRTSLPGGVNTGTASRPDPTR
jgi:hypothetical protein